MTNGFAWADSLVSSFTCSFPSFMRQTASLGHRVQRNQQIQGILTERIVRFCASESVEAINCSFRLQKTCTGRDVENVPSFLVHRKRSLALVYFTSVWHQAQFGAHVNRTIHWANMQCSCSLLFERPIFS